MLFTRRKSILFSILLFILLSPVLILLVDAVPTSRSLKRVSDEGVDLFLTEKNLRMRMDLEILDYGTGANNRHDLRILPPAPPPPEAALP